MPKDCGASPEEHFAMMAAALANAGIVPDSFEPCEASYRALVEYTEMIRIIHDFTPATAGEIAVEGATAYLDTRQLMKEDAELQKLRAARPDADPDPVTRALMLTAEELEMIYKLSPDKKGN